MWTRWRLVTLVGTLGAAFVACLGWVPFLHKPLSPDEGGFLLVASQWSPGPSLYGSYWVDRPPLLIEIFGVAQVLGGATALRLIGAVAAVASTLLAAGLARAVLPSLEGGAGGLSSSGRTFRILGVAAVAAAFTSTPAFGAPEVDGEILAVPFVLAGTLFLVRAWAAHHYLPLVVQGIVAGFCGACALLVKQNVVDVPVVAVALLATHSLGRYGRRGFALSAFVALGAIATLGVALGIAALRGTGPGPLWMALGPFRVQAVAALDTYARGRTERLQGLMRATVLSGALLLVVVVTVQLVAAARVNRRSGCHSPSLVAPSISLLAWELAAVALGGSFWSHYLTGLVPGLVLLTVAAAQTPVRAWWPVLVAAAACLCSSLVTMGGTAVGPATPDAAIATYIHDHARSRDSLVVCFGHPDIIWDAGLQSPYPWLWSLPVQVKDHRLTRLSAVLQGPSRPTWLVVRGHLADWGVAPRAGWRVIHRDFHVVKRVGTSTIYHVDG